MSLLLLLKCHCCIVHCEVYPALHNVQTLLAIVIVYDSIIIIIIIINRFV